MSVAELQVEIRELKRRVDLAETQIAQLNGQFEFISSQLRDVQRYMHVKFADVDKKLAEHDRRFDAIDRRFDRLEVRMDGVEAKIDALPRVIAELIAKNR